MPTIVPAILPTSRKDLEEKLEQLVGIASDVQVDIVDGIFASPASWPYEESEGVFSIGEEGMLPHIADFRMEVDLMVHDPEQVVGAWIQAGASRVTVHLESTTSLQHLIADLKKNHGYEKGMGLLSLGIAINVETDLALLGPYLSDIDYVQFMGIRSIGKQGQPFAEEVLHSIDLFRHKHRNVLMQIDGGVDLNTAPRLLDAGISRLVVGSDLWHAPNVKEEFERLVALTETHGLYEQS